jgi:hypothetical protein
MILNLLLMLLNLHEVFLLLLLVLEAINVALDFIFKHFLGLVDVLSDRLLELAALHLADGLFLFALSLSLSSVSCNLHIALAGLKDVTSAFLGFVEFLPRLQ